MDELTRYWGIWQDDIGFLCFSNGMLIYYPHPGIAQAHAKDLMHGNRLQTLTNLTVREFVYDPVEPQNQTI